jgi:adenylate kinase family enzyme
MFTENHGRERLINTKNSKNMAETPQTIVKRFSQYIKETEPVLDLYRQQGLVITINCERGS